MKTFFTYEEDEAYRQGRKDADYGRTDHFRTSRSFAEYDTPDKAYWIGQDERKHEKDVAERQREYWDEQYDRWRNG
jgi:hypothetical protein